MILSILRWALPQWVFISLQERPHGRDGFQGPLKNRAEGRRSCKYITNRLSRRRKP
jgi:hypothetical protein